MREASPAGICISAACQLSFAHIQNVSFVCENADETEGNTPKY